MTKETQEKLNTFSLYLAKSEVKDFDDLLTDSARDLVKAGIAKKVTSKKLGESAVLYTFANESKLPKWVKLVESAFEVPKITVGESHCAIAAFKKDESIFVLTFSYGHVYLDISKTESEFGLRVAINAVSDDKLRSVEKANIGVAIRDFAQAAGQRDFKEFGFDDALDLIRKVSGYASNSDFANLVTGAHALKFSKKINILKVPDVALSALKLFKAKTYKSTSFRIIDLLSPVTDTSLIPLLDEEMANLIRSGSDDFEVAIPKILPDHVCSFQFKAAGISKFYADLSLDLYRDGLGEKLETLTAYDLKHHAIAVFCENEDRPYEYWPLYRSILGSLTYQSDKYAFNEGAWYRVTKTLKDKAEQKFNNLVVKSDANLKPLKKISIKEEGKKERIGYQSEKSYNEEIAKDTGYLLLDSKLIQIDDVAGGGIEACDLIDIEGCRFIHVKKSSRQSSILSHFFKQGCNAAKMLRQFPAFEAGLIEQVKADYGAAKAKELEAALKTKKWTVDFQIADYPRQNGAFNIPFFSKLTLQEESRVIEAMNFDVQVGFIKLARIEETVPKMKKAA